MSEFDKWADEKERWDGEHSEARPLARLAWDFQQARIEALEEALTPSAETKAAYWGEAGLTNDWTLIKAVMKAIRERALQEPAK